MPALRPRSLHQPSQRGAAGQRKEPVLQRRTLLLVALRELCVLNQHRERVGGLAPLALAELLDQRRREGPRFDDRTDGLVDPVVHEPRRQDITSVGAEA